MLTGWVNLYTGETRRAVLPTGNCPVFFFPEPLEWSVFHILPFGKCRLEPRHMSCTLRSGYKVRTTWVWGQGSWGSFEGLRASAGASATWLLSQRSLPSTRGIHPQR